MEDKMIQIAGLKEFPRGQWRNALRYYLTGMLEERGSVTYRPKADFENWGFRFHPLAGVYTFWGDDAERISRQQLETLLEAEATTHVCNCTRDSFERGFWRFMSDDGVWRMVIHLPNESFLIAKEAGKRGGKLHVSVTCDELTVAETFPDL